MLDDTPVTEGAPTPVSLSDLPNVDAVLTGMREVLVPLTQPRVSTPPPHKSASDDFPRVLQSPKEELESFVAPLLTSVLADTNPTLQLPS
jgi:hypothetical protein